MHIKEIKISNLLSFPYKEDFENMEKISFFSNGWYEGLRILIGNNASGKSNFVTILEEFFSTLIKDYHYSREFSQNPEIPMRKAIQAEKNLTKKLHTNYATPNKPSDFEILLELWVNDYENIGFVCKYTGKINDIISKYSKLNISFPQYKLETLMEKSSNLRIKASFDEKEQQFIIDERGLEEYQIFILQCIQYQKLLQIIITIFNEFEKKPEERKRYFLKKTFAILNTERSQFEFSNFVNPHDIINDINYTRNSLVWYATCIWKLWSIVENFSQSQLLSPNQSHSKPIQDELEKSEFYTSLSYIIDKYLWKKLHIDYVNWMLNIHLIDSQERIVYFDELSSWERSLLTIIFAMYGNDLKEGFLIINEPELHLHPQIQKEIAQVFDHVSQNINSQFIFSTNSGLFINEGNITNVYRVYRNEQTESQIISPKIQVDYDDATLIHMLKFENLSKIFFVNKIILVEWDTDAYFFSFYLNYLKTLPEWKSKISDYEVININGKWSLHAWRKFLNKFNIKNYFIWDWDNTVDYWFFSTAELNKFYQLANQNLKHSPKTKEKKYSDYYNRLVKTILSFSPKKYKAIIKWIERLYKEKIFILKEGAIESYVIVERKGLGHIAHFCNEYFHDRLHNPLFASQRKELKEIMSQIFW